MERLEERADAVAVLVDERLAANHAVADEERLSRDVLESGARPPGPPGRAPAAARSPPRALLDAGAPRKAEHPLVVDDRDLEVVPLVDLDDRSRAASKRVCDQPVAVARHPVIAVKSLDPS
jgi:hypothetical protein